MYPIVFSILDPEHKQPFFSLDAIFLLAGLSVPSGLTRFRLRRDKGDFDLTLAGLEPREAIWSPWHVAHSVVQELDLLPALQSLFSCRHAWSLDEDNEGLTHNWCVSSEQIDPSTYSLSALLEQQFDTITLQPKGQQIRTLISTAQRDYASDCGIPACLWLGMSDNGRTRRVRTEQQLLRWAVRSFEQWNEVQEQDDVDEGDLDELEFGLWTPSSVDILLFLRDLLSTRINDGGQGNDDAIDEKLDIDGRQGRMSYNEIKSWQIQQENAQMDPQQSVVSRRERQTHARISLLLVDHLWRAHLDHAILSARQDVSSAQAATGQQTEPEEGVASAGPTSLDVRLERIEVSAQRTGEVLCQLLSYQKGLERVAPMSDQARPLRRPATTDFVVLACSWHSIVALLLGVILGSAIVRALHRTDYTW